MDSKAKNSLYSFLYLFALYLAIRLLPLTKWCGSLLWLSKVLLIFLFAALICLGIYESRKLNFSFPKKKHISFFLLLPLTIGCISNFLYCLIFQIPQSVSISPLFSLDIVSSFLGVVIEEFLFRYFFISFLDSFLKEEKKKPFYIILFSSIAFSLMHCINFFGNNPLSVLLQIGYTFLLGFAFGYLTLSFSCLQIAVFGHFLFNFFNTDLFIHFYDLTIDYKYVLFSLGIGLFIFFYLFLIYHLNWRKQNEYNK